MADSMPAASSAVSPTRASSDPAPLSECIDELIPALIERERGAA